MNIRSAIVGLVLIQFGLAASATTETDPPSPYTTIPLEPVLTEQRVIRPDSDKLLVGQIVSEKGAERFRAEYGVALKTDGIDFDRQMLVFGITDIIYTRAFQLLRNRQLDDGYVLDYFNAGIYRDLPNPGEGKKYSIVQVFATNRIERMIGNIKVKNLTFGASKVFADGDPK